MQARLQSQLLQELLDYWHAEHLRRAKGGLWALAGFGLQAGWFLLRFFRGVVKQREEPGRLAEIERLSDLLCPTDGLFVLIQAKRTLTKPKLIDALEEFYLITDLCRRRTPDLLPRLQFQIVCERRKTPLTPYDLELEDVISQGGNHECWQSMVDRINGESPILEERDPLDALHVFLWNEGLKDTSAFVNSCLGRLIAYFTLVEPHTADLGRILATDFAQAERRGILRSDFDFLTADDVRVSDKAATSTRVLIDRKPRLKDLQDGCFKERTQIFNPMKEVATNWIEALPTESENVPIFWIHGRSGEGKSVLLLQLVAELVERNDGWPLLHLDSGNDIPKLLGSLPEQLGNAGSSARAIAIVDDIYQLRAIDQWDESVSNTLSRRIPPVAIITCGPTDQLERFEAHQRGQFEVTRFYVPPIDLEECREFATFYENRTHQKRYFSDLTTENPLLVLLMFELAQGESLPSFARRFRKRLEQIGLFEDARTIVAANALYCEAPFQLLSDDRARDALMRLCHSDQMHFRITTVDDGSPIGIWLAHPHLSYEFLRQWIDPPTTLAMAWGRELAKTLTFLESDQEFSARNFINLVISTDRMTDEPQQSLTPNRADVIGEFYRSYVNKRGGSSGDSLLPGWLDVLSKVKDISLTPNPLDCAVSAMSDEERASRLSGAVGSWVWVLAESRPKDEAAYLRDTVRHFFRRHPSKPGVGFALNRIASLNDVDSKNLVLEWLRSDGLCPDAYSPLATLTRTYSNDTEVKCLAIAWLDKNPSHLNAYWLLSAMVAAQPEEEDVKQHAINWLDENLEHPNAYELLVTMVAAQPEDEDVKQHAINWLDKNLEHRNAYELLVAMVAAQPEDVDVKQRAINWVDENLEHPNAYVLLVAMVAAHPEDEDVKQRAINWLDENLDNPNACNLLVTVIPRSDGNETWMKRGEEYLQDPKGRNRQNIVSVLVSAGKADSKYLELMFEYIDSLGKEDAKHRKSVLYHLARALARNPGNAAKYLNGKFDENRKRIVSWHLAIGLKNLPDYLPEFAKINPRQLDSFRVGWILQNLVQLELKNDLLNDLLVSWLQDNFRRKGYGGLLDALRQQNDQWRAIEPRLSKDIQADFFSQHVFEK